MKLILSLSHLRYNSGEQNHFQGGKMPPLSPPRKIPVYIYLNLRQIKKMNRTMIFHECSGIIITSIHSYVTCFHPGEFKFFKLVFDSFYCGWLHHKIAYKVCAISINTVLTSIIWNYLGSYYFNHSICLIYLANHY